MGNYRFRQIVGLPDHGVCMVWTTALLLG